MRLRAAAITLGVLLPLGGLAAAPASPSGAADARHRTAAELPEHLLDQLPATAAEAGLDYAPRLVSVEAPTRAQRDAVVASGLDVVEHVGHDTVEVVLTSQEEQDRLDALGFDHDVVTPDLVAQEHERILADAAYARATAASPLPSGRDTYRVLADFGEEIDQLAADHPDLAKRISVGRSVEGRDLTGIEIAAEVTAPADGRPVLLVFGTHHAREWPSAETPMEFAHDLVTTFVEGDPRTVDLLTRARVVIVPVSNPDGFEISRTQGDLVDLNSLDGGGTVSILATPGGAYKRKNCRIIDGQSQPPGPCALAVSPGGFGVGIDLNRNYGALWGGPGAAAEPVDPTYRGPAPFSEPETQAIRELISTRQVTTLISNHTFSNLLLRPVGVQPSTVGPDGLPVGFAPDECFDTPDGDDGMQALGLRMAAQTGYSNQFGWELYDTTGTTEDYSYNATGGYGYTFEIGPDQFHPPFEEVVAEYLGTTDAAEAVTPDRATALTSAAGRDCGDVIEPESVGGGLREAYFLALENAANSATHSRLVGEAPAGAEIAVTRTGTFPLWDGTPVEDTVTTSMVVGDDGTFDYHVNPSTRPFVASRPYTEGEATGPEVEVSFEEERTGTALPPATGTSDEPVEVPEGVDSLVVTVTADVPADDYDVELLSPDLVVLDSSANGFTDERVEHVVATGIQPGEYVVRITNFAAVGPWRMTVTMGTVPDDATTEDDLQFSPGTTEAWTVTCAVDDEVVASRDVVVDRGQVRDLGAFCAAGEDVTPAAPAPTPDAAPGGEATAGGARSPLPTTGGGAVAAALLALLAVAGRRRRTT